jgi:pyridoxine kinase
MTSLKGTIQVLHDKYRIPHIIITSVNLEVPDLPPRHLSVVGSSMTSSGKARLFKIVFPAIDCYFCGTGDMFAALTVVRMREAVNQVPGLKHSPSWLSDDSVDALELPLAKAAEKVLASMHEVLTRTADAMKAHVKDVGPEEGAATDERLPSLHLRKSKAAELRLVRNVSCLKAATVEFKATKI